MTKAPITTHILNLDSGKPAAGVEVKLYLENNSKPIAQGTTDNDGRILSWDQNFMLETGVYRLLFSVGDWYSLQGRASFYPQVDVMFNVANDQEHYHIPLLLNAHGYSTYRGS